MIYTRYNQYKEESVSMVEQVEGTEKTKEGQTKGSGIKRNKIKELREIISKAKAEEKEAEEKKPTDAKENDPTKWIKEVWGLKKNEENKKKNLNIRTMLYLIRKAYEIRKRLYLIQKTVGSLVEEVEGKGNQEEQKSKSAKETNIAREQTYKPRGIYFRGRARNYSLANTTKEINTQQKSWTEGSGSIQISQQKHNGVIKKINQIAQSIEKTYWLKYKLDINYVVHSKNMSYIKTKIHNVQNKHISTLGAVLGKSKVFAPLAQLYKNIRKLDQSENTTGSQRQETKANNTTPYFFLYLLYKRFIVMHLWKMYINRMSTNKMKYYKVYLINTVLKTLSGLVYIIVDSLKLLTLAGIESLPQNSIIVAPSTTGQTQKQENVVVGHPGTRSIPIASEGQISENKQGAQASQRQETNHTSWNRRMLSQSNQKGKGSGLSFIALTKRVETEKAEENTAGKTNKQRVTLTIKQGVDQAIQLRQGDIIYLSFQRVLENINQLGYINYIGGSVFKNMIWPCLNQATKGTLTDSKKETEAEGVASETKGSGIKTTQKNEASTTNQQKEGGQAKLKAKESNEQPQSVNQKQKRESERSLVERSAPRILLQKAQMRGANLSIQIETQVPETLRSPDFHKEIITTRNGRDNLVQTEGEGIEERAGMNRTRIANTTWQIKPFKRFTKSISLYVDEKGGMSNGGQQEQGPRSGLRNWEIRKIEFERAEKEKESLYFFFHRFSLKTKMEEANKRKESWEAGENLLDKHKYYTALDSLFGKLNKTSEAHQKSTNQQNTNKGGRATHEFTNLKQIYLSKRKPTGRSKNATATTENNLEYLTPFVPYIGTNVWLNRKTLFSPMVYINTMRGPKDTNAAQKQTTGRMGTQQQDKITSDNTGNNSGGAKKQSLPLQTQTRNHAPFSLFAFAAQIKASARMVNQPIKYPNLFFDALTKQISNSTYIAKVNQSSPLEASEGAKRRSSRIFVGNEATAHRDELLSSSFLPLPKHPQYVPTTSGHPETLALTWPISFAKKEQGQSGLESSFMKPLDIIVKYHHSKAHNAAAFTANLSRFLIAFLKKNKGSKNKFQQLKNVTFKAIRSTGKDRFLGVGFRYSGRVYGAKKAASFKMLFGSVPFSTLDANVDYSSLTQKTRNGTWGFQTWLHLKQKKSLVHKKNIILNAARSPLFKS